MSNTSTPTPYLVDIIAGLAASNNQVAAGLGETLLAFVAAASAPSSAPLVIEFGHRTMALGRKRMASMTGRVSPFEASHLLWRTEASRSVPLPFQNAFVYLKSKFGLLNATVKL